MSLFSLLPCDTISNACLMVLETSQTAECGDDRSDRDGLGNERRGTASLTDRRVTAECAGMAAGPHRCV